MSTSAGPASGLTSSITESCSGPDPTPANHCDDEGTLQSCVVSGSVPYRNPRSPGARVSSPLITAAPVPGSGATAPSETGTWVLVSSELTERSPDAPLAVPTQPSGEAESDVGQTTVALVSWVRAGR